MTVRVIPQHVLDRAAAATPGAPFRIVVSACLAGQAVGFDGSSWPNALIAHLDALPNTAVLPFCPEDFGLGTPRPWMAIHGGDGRAVLEGRARIIDVEGTDVTEGFMRGGREMVRRATAHDAELAILMETSPSCATHVLHRGEAWPDREYRQGMGTTATFLTDAGVPVIAQRDLRSLYALIVALDPGWQPPDEGHDVPDDPWHREYFG